MIHYLTKYRCGATKLVTHIFFVFLRTDTWADKTSTKIIYNFKYFVGKEVAFCKKLPLWYLIIKLSFAKIRYTH